jgi:hypothetical protein
MIKNLHIYTLRSHRSRESSYGNVNKRSRWKASPDLLPGGFGSVEAGLGVGQANVVLKFTELNVDSNADADASATYCRQYGQGEVLASKQPKLRPLLYKPAGKLWLYSGGLLQTEKSSSGNPFVAVDVWRQ